MKNTTPNIFSTIAILAVSSATFSQAAIIVSDPFTDGAKSNGADPLDTQWYYTGAGTAAVTATSGGSGVGAAANGVLAGNPSLAYNPDGGFRGLYGNFTSTTLGPVGSETSGLLLTFDFRLRSTTSNTTGFRFGLINQLGTNIIDDGTAPAGTGNTLDDSGFLNTVAIGGPTANLVQRTDLTTGSGPFGANGPEIGSSTQSFSLSSTVARSASFLVQRDGTGTLTLSTTIYGEAGLTGAVLGTVTTTGYTPPDSTYFTFDTIGVGLGSNGNNYSIDNVVLQSVPEPSSLTLLGLGALALLRRRR